MTVDIKKILNFFKDVIEISKILSSILPIAIACQLFFWKVYKNDYYFYLSLILALIIFWILFLGYIRKKVKSSIVPKHYFYKFKDHAFYSILSTIFFLILLCYFIEKIYLTYNIESKKVVVLIIPFKNETDSTKEIFSSQLYGKLNEQLDTDESIKIELLGDPISESEGGINEAKLIANKKNASILIWGWYSKSSTSVYLKTKFEILNPLLENIKPDISIQNQDKSFQIDKLNNFELQTKVTNNNSFLIFSCLGSLKYIQNKWKEGIDYFDKAFKFKSNDINMSTMSLCKGNCFYALRELDSASYYCNQSIKYNKEFIPAYITLGNISAKKNQFELALGYYNAALDRDPDNTIAYNNIGVVYIKIGQYYLAEQNFAHAYTIYPGDSITIRNETKMAEIYNKHQQEVEINKKHKNFDGLYKALIRRCIFFSKLKKYREALSDIDSCIKMAPDSSNLYIMRGNLEDDGENKREQSFQDYSYALKLNPKSYLAYYERAVIYKRMGKVKFALDDYNKSIALHPTSEAYNNLASIYMNRKMYKKAYENFHLALNICTPIDSAIYKEHMNAALYHLKKNDKLHQ